MGACSTAGLCLSLMQKKHKKKKSKEQDGSGASPSKGSEPIAERLEVRLQFGAAVDNLTLEISGWQDGAT